ncbi:MAG: hypothetical protein SNH63_01440 [Rikenellaceae bacterium]
MRRIKEVVLLTLLLLLSAPSLVLAESGALSVYSPYSIYGLGSLSTQGTLQTRSMGGAGVAMRNPSTINLLNPASYSTQLQRSILFDFGMEGGQYMLSQNSAAGQSSTNYTTLNFKEIAFQVPVAKGLGFGFSMTPYSSVGYSNYEEIIMADYYVGMLQEGYGDIAEAKFGIGWEFLPGVSIGVAGQYYWGDLSRTFDVAFVNITAGGDVLSMSGIDYLSVSSLKAQAGLQWDVIKRRNKMLTLGATYDLGGDLSPQYIRVIDDEGSTDSFYTQSDTTTISLIQPRQLSFGVSYVSDRLALSADYSMQDWKSGNESISYENEDGMLISYCNVSQIRFGVEYTPRYSDVRNYFNRVNYRAGVRFGNSQYSFGGTQLAEYAVTAGMGFPINMIGITRINMGLEWGSVGALSSVNVNGSDVGLIRQNQFKVAFSFTMFGDDYWFHRYLID